jgi:hypothetical protein
MGNSIEYFENGNIKIECVVNDEGKMASFYNKDGKLLN